MQTLDNDNDGDEASEMDLSGTAPHNATGTDITASGTIPTVAPSGTTKTFTIKGQNFSFAPGEIKVNKGDTVKIIFENTGGFHDWVIDEFNAKTATVGSGQNSTVEFVADKVGTFQYYCSVGNHRQMGMVGNLIVQ